MARRCLHLLASPCGPRWGPAHPDDQRQENREGEMGQEKRPLCSGNDTVPYYCTSWQPFCNTLMTGVLEPE